MRSALLLSITMVLPSQVGCARAHERTTDFFADRAAHPTVLVKHGPSPQSYAPWPKDGPLHVVEYPSMGRILRGLLALPTEQGLAVDGKVPVLVYLHGGFALGRGDVRDCLPFLREGVAVWAPAWRGENGNPGDYELGFGELEDARAAIDFVRSIPGLDPSRVVVFGHSAGGRLSALLALSPDLPVRDTASAGGLHDLNAFDAMDLPFADSRDEREMRLFVSYARQLKQPHFACVGNFDLMSRFVVAAVANELAETPLPFVEKMETGTHQTSLRPCMEAYLARVLPKLK